MRKFLLMIIGFFGLYVAGVLVFVSVRVALAQPEDRKAIDIHSGQDILFIGDSHVGCIFAERPEFHNKVIWCESLPAQFTLMRLRDLEASGQLSSVKIFVTDCWAQNIGYQSCDGMCLWWFRSLPFSWAHFSDTPLSYLQAISYLATHFTDEMRGVAPFEISDVSICSRSQEERDYDLRETTRAHFKGLVTDDKLCDGWEESLRSAYAEMKRICDRNQIRMVAIVAPAASWYRQAVPSIVADTQRRVLLSQIKDLKIPFCDAMNWMPDSAFRDCFHLTKRGSEEFTKMFYEKFLSTML